MLCQLGDFMFESDGVNLANIKRSFSFDFEETARMDDFAAWTASGAFSQSITLGGALLAQSNSALADLEAMAKKKEPVTLAFESGKALKVLILNVDFDQSSFLKNGVFLKQDFQVQLGVVYGDV